MDKNIIEQLLETTAKGLYKRLQSDDATASDFKNAIEFLKTNGITFDTTKTASPNKADELLREALPFKEEFKETEPTDSD